MKRKSAVLMCLVLLFSLAMPVFAENVNELDNADDQAIMDLLEQRAMLLRQDNPNSSSLADINTRLTELGVTFLSTEEASEHFPDAVESVSAHSTETANGTPNIRVAVPQSNVNDWSTYRTTYVYNGNVYNIQKLVVIPIDEANSVLWDESAVTINYDINWVAGTTEFFKAVASVGVSELAPISSTVYDVFSSVWNGLQTVSTIDPCSVYYTWENSTTVIFSYVRLQSESDDAQRLSLISSSCTTSVGFVADIDRWSESGNGVMIPYPEHEAGSKTISSTPWQYNGNVAACQSYANGVTAANACVKRIRISGPESKVVVNIYPCVPQFPLQCE